MTSAEVLQAWFEGLWNQADESTIDRLAATGIVAHDQIVEGWNYFDFLSLATQMGAVPANALEAAMTAVARQV